MILGIDFGTTNTCISYFNYNKTNLLQIENKYYIPSKIFIHNNNIIYFGSELDYLDINNGLLIDNFKILVDSDKKYKINNKIYSNNQLIYLFLKYVKKKY